MLWHIEDSNADILGSIHVMDPASLVLSQHVDEAYLRAQRLAFEYDFSAQPSPSAVSLPQGETLSRKLPAALFSALRGLWTEAGLPEAGLESTPPWLAALQLQFTLAARRGISHERGVDRLLWQRAMADRKEILGLETPDAALRGFLLAPPDEQVRFLSYIVENPDQSQAEIDATIAAWRSGRIETLEPFLARWLRLCPLMFEMLIADRNKTWLPRLRALAGDGVPTLVVVGAIHCTGRTGLPNLLAESGSPAFRADIGA